VRKDPNSPTSLGITLACAAVIALALYLAPALVTAYVRRLGFTPASAGYVISAEMAGMGMASIPALWWLRQLDWGRVAIIALVAAATGDFVSAFLSNAVALGSARLLTGVAEGTVSIVCMSALRLTRDPNRSFGYWLFAQLAFGALALLAFPILFGLGGLAGIYGTLGIFLLALSVIAKLIPTGHTQGHAATAAASNVRAWSLAGIAGLAALLLLYIAFSAIWSFTGQMAGRDVPPERTAYALSLAPLGGMAGSAIAGAIGTRFGSAAPLLCGVSILAVAVMILGHRPDWHEYVASCLAVLLGWTLSIPFLLGAIARIDYSGQLTATANIVIGVGLAAGPAISGAVVGTAGEYQSVVMLSLACCAGSYLAAIPALRARV
jgi:MFS transporter, DHA1 family, inner membrane transport protein